MSGSSTNRLLCKDKTREDKPIAAGDSKAGRDRDLTSEAYSPQVP